MLYQFYFQEEQLDHCQDSPLYRPLGLHRGVNPKMAAACPEIETPEQSRHMNENAGILFLGRRLPHDGHDWIGVTSHRQLEKRAYIFSDEQVIADAIANGDGLAWWQQQVPETIPFRIESSHPGLHSFLIQMFRDLGEELPAEYFTAKNAAWCNYWIMSKARFAEYHEWFSKFALYTLAAIKSPTPQQAFFLNSGPRHGGNLLEMVFQIWCYKNRLRLYCPWERVWYHYDGSAKVQALCEAAAPIIIYDQPQTHTPPTATVTVVITCHNYGHFLKDCIDSVLNQTVPVTNVRIVDDASKDDTATVAGQFYSDPRFYYSRVEFHSCYEARQAGLMQAADDYVIFLDADDMLSPRYVEKCMAALEADQHLGVCTTDLQNFGLEHSVTVQKYDNINRSNWFHAGSMFRRDALINAKAFDRDTLADEVCEDWYTVRRVLNYGYDAAKIDEPLYLYRKHEASRSHTHKARYTYYDWAGLRYETPTVVRDWRTPCGDSEYMVYPEGGPPSAGEIQQLLRKMSFETATAVHQAPDSTRLFMIRRSVLQEVPPQPDETLDQWRNRVAATGFEWSGPSAPGAKPITVVLITPVLTVGGAEHWVKTMAISTRKDKIKWRVVLLRSDQRHQDVVRPLKRAAELYYIDPPLPCTDTDKIFPDGPSAIAAASQGADIIITWGEIQFWPLKTDLPVVLAIHGTCQYTKNIVDSAVRDGHVKHFVAVSHLAKERTTTPDIDTEVIWNCVDARRLKVTSERRDVQLKRWGVPHDWWVDQYIHVGYFGRIAFEKNTLSIASAVASLPCQFHCVFIGDGFGREKIIPRAHEILRERFHVLESVDDVGNHFAAMDVCVMVGKDEGCSLTLIEAMLCGVPMVTTRTGTVPEFEAAAGETLFWSVPDMPTSNEIALAIREAVAAGRYSDRVLAAKRFAWTHLADSQMADRWTDYLYKTIAKHHTVTEPV